jgi:hypothetical protein
MHSYIGNLSYRVAIYELGTFCHKSSSTKAFRFKGLHVFRSSTVRSGDTLHCCIQWENG